MPELNNQTQAELDYLMAGAIGALGAIFIACFAILLYIICIRQRGRNQWERFDKKKSSKKGESELAVALSEIGLANAWEKILSDEHWINDASGLIPECLGVLRTCHNIIEQLINLAVQSRNDSANKIVECALLKLRIPSRVDDVVKSMYPPLDPRLLEARTAALILEVGQLTYLAQDLSGFNKQHFIWMDRSRRVLDSHLEVLRKASNELEATLLNNDAANSQI